jgi:putative addiction module component (TIGR02574 family)
MNTINATDLLHLSTAERLRLAEELWDSVARDAAHDAATLPVPDAQRDEILRRSAAYHANPHDAVPLDEALARIERALG